MIYDIHIIPTASMFFTVCDVCMSVCPFHFQRDERTPTRTDVADKVSKHLNMANPSKTLTRTRQRKNQLASTISD